MSERVRWFVVRATLGAVLLALAGLTGTQAAAPERGREALRRLVQLPTLELGASFAFTADSLSLFDGEAAYFGADPAQAIRQLEERPDRDESPHTLFALSRLYRKAGRLSESEEALDRALSLYERRLRTRPDDPELLTGYGQALTAMERYTQAEAVLRRAVRQAPTEWRGWVALGWHCDLRARQALKLETDFGPSNLMNRVPKLDDFKLEGEQVNQARRWLREAEECFEHAVECAKEEPAVYFARAGHRATRGFFAFLLDLARGEKPESKALLEHVLSPECLHDLRETARLNPRDYQTLAVAAMLEVAVRLPQLDPAQHHAPNWATLPMETQQFLRSAMHRLETLSEVADPKAAAGAAHALGMLKFMVAQDSASALALLRRALDLDPAREETFELLAGLLARQRRYQELLGLCQQRVAYDPTVKHRLLLAKTLTHLQRWDEAGTQIALALNQAPRDFLPNLARAAWLIRQERDEARLQEAEYRLFRCRIALERMSKDNAQVGAVRRALIDFSLTAAIYEGQRGHSANARALAEKVLELDPHNDQAEAILLALD